MSAIQPVCGLSARQTRNRAVSIRQAGFPCVRANLAAGGGILGSLNSGGSARLARLALLAFLQNCSDHMKLLAIAEVMTRNVYLPNHSMATYSSPGRRGAALACLGALLASLGAVLGFPGGSPEAPEELPGGHFRR